MKKEVLKIGVTLVSLILCVLLIDFGVGKVFDSLLAKLPSEGERVAKSNFILTKVNSDIVIVGSSRAECNYNSRLMQDADLGGAVFNCGVDGALFFYEVAVINSILDRYTPKIIIWDLQLNELAESKQVENLGLLYPYYWRNEYICQFLNNQEPDLKYKIWLNAYRYNATASRIIRSLRIPQSDQLGFLAHSSEATYKSERFFSSELKQESLDERKVLMFEETIQRCTSLGVRTVILHSPYYRGMIGETTTTKLAKDVCSKYGAELINDSQLPEFVGAQEYIYDAIHLNEKGATLFTSILIKQLKSGENENKADNE